MKQKSIHASTLYLQACPIYYIFINEWKKFSLLLLWNAYSGLIKY
jgi:hypothetical protein